MHVVLTIWRISWILALVSIAYWLFWYASTKILTTCGVLILFSRSALSKSFAFFSHYHKLKLDQSMHYCLCHYTSCQAHWNYERYTQEKIAAQNNIGSNAVKNLAQDFFFYYLLHFNYSFLFSVTGNIKLLLTLILKDPWRVAFTWSKSAFMARRKWSDGLRRAGQGNPAAAKCCKIYPPSQLIQLVCLFGFHREAVTLATETLMGVAGIRK
jgi:hypothetical protein